jgi:acyl dehydratase
MIVIDGVAGLRARAGTELGVADWYTVTQDEIDAFARATGDFEWIHVDVERAASGAYGGTIAHGLFTLSLGPRFSYELYKIQNISHMVNYGYARVRFPAPLPVGSRVRMRSTLADVKDVAGAVQCTFSQTFECEGVEKPVCVADNLTWAFDIESA